MTWAFGGVRHEHKALIGVLGLIHVRPTRPPSGLLVGLFGHLSSLSFASVKEPFELRT